MRKSFLVRYLSVMRNPKPSLQPLPGSVAESAARRCFQMRHDRRAMVEGGSVLPGHRTPFLFLTWLRVACQKKRRLP